jgi:hypothetical protein
MSFDGFCKLNRRRVLFFDDFLGTTLDYWSPDNRHGKWKTYYEGLDPFSGHVQWDGNCWNLNPLDARTLNRSPYSVSNSILTISAFRTPADIADAITAENGGTPVPWCGGALIQNVETGQPAFRVGSYFEARVRAVETGKGMHPAFWVNAPNNCLISKGGAEVDIDERFATNQGSKQTVWAVDIGRKGHAYDVGSVGSSPAISSDPTPNPAQIDLSQYHVFGFDWQEKWLRFYLDDQPISHLAIADNNAGFAGRPADGFDAAGWFAEDAELALKCSYSMDPSFLVGMGLGSDTTTPSLLTYQVDWVKVWDCAPGVERQTHSW